MDMVGLTVSTGLGVSFLAGLLSGVCYILAYGFPKKVKRNSRKSLRKKGWMCAVCSTPFRSLEGVLEDDLSLVKCQKCTSTICRQTCSTQGKNGEWLCESCRHPVELFLNNLFGWTIKLPSLVSKGNFDVEMPAKKQEVRDFIERVVSSLLGDGIDDASVGKLYQDALYESLFNKYHEDLSDCLSDLGSALHTSMSNLPVSGQSPCSAHATLKQLIKRLLEEAANLPVLKEENEGFPEENASKDCIDRTYEDLLATAILNKVIASCQNNVASSSRASSRISNHSKEYFFGNETLEAKWKTTDLDTTSISSLEELISSDSTKYVDRKTLTVKIKHDFEEVYSDEDDEKYFEQVLLEEEDKNWFLQKRHFQGSHSPVPVPMLVPNPVQEAKVLIGDKDVEETSDLSDVESDFGDTESLRDVKSLLIESKNLIGGVHPLKLEGVTLDETSDFICKTDNTIDDDNVEDSSILSVYSNTEQDAEYVESYASLPRTIVKEEHQEKAQSSSEEEFQAGQYGKKEKEKWKNAIFMENNPYSKENIEKRIESNFLFGRDYYARQASKPSGIAPKTLQKDEAKEDFIKPEEPLKNEEESQEETLLIDESLSSTINSDVMGEITSDSDFSYVNCYEIETSQISRVQSEKNANKKRDNTWISKIHDNARVRSFGGITREVVITDKTKKEQNSIQNEKKIDEAKKENSFEIKEDKEIKKENPVHEVKKENLLEDPIINELQENHFVANLMNKYRLAFPNLVIKIATKAKLSEESSAKEVKSEELQGVSVRERRKLFESIKNPDKPISSLTARSVPKSMREKLRN